MCTGLSHRQTEHHNRPLTWSLGAQPSSLRSAWRRCRGGLLEIRSGLVAGGYGPGHFAVQFASRRIVPIR